MSDLTKLEITHPLTGKLAKEWLSLYEKQGKHRITGKTIKWLFASRDNGVEHSQKKPDAIVIVAVFQERYLVVTKEWRMPIGEFQYGFPAGLIDKGETPEQAAVREFREETGLDFEVKYSSPPNLYTSAGMSNESVQMVFGEAYGEVSAKHMESTEDITVLLADMDQIREFVKANLAHDAKAWVIFHMFACMGRLQL